MKGLVKTAYSKHSVETKKSDPGAKFFVDDDPRDQSVDS